MNLRLIVGFSVGLVAIGGALSVSLDAIESLLQRRASVAATVPSSPVQNPQKSVAETATLFVRTSQGDKLACAMMGQNRAMEIEMHTSSGFEPVTDCINRHEKEVATAYSELLPRLTSSSSQEALKNYYANWLTAIEATVPNAGESDEELSHRQDQSFANLEFLGNRLRVETQD
jgi:hypothetical protein